MNKTSIKHDLSPKSRAQAMVEFSLVLPILLLLIYGLLEVGRLVFIYSSVVSAARQAVRYGATTGILPGQLETDPNALRRYNDCTGMREAAQRMGFIEAIADTDIEVWNDEGEGISQASYCTPGSAIDTSFEPSTGNISRIRVEVRSQYSPIVPLVPLGPFEISSVSARTILVSVPIVVDVGGQSWEPTPPVNPPSPAAFNKLSPSNGATNQETSVVTLTWQPSANATSYEVCYDTINDNTCSSSWVNNGSTTSTQISDLTLGDTYYWHVRAVNASGTTYSNGALAAFWSFTTSILPPHPPAAFTKSSPSNSAANQETSVTLAWQASTGATSYDVCYDTTDNNACAWVNNGSSTSKQISNLESSTTYYWHVRALNESGTTYSNGAPAAFWSFTTAAPPPPPAAFNKLSPSNGATDQGTSVTLTWQPSANATSYEVCYDTTNHNACSSSWINNGSTTSIQISNLATSKIYYWHVRAVNASGTIYSNGALAAFWSFTTAAPPIPAAFSKLNPVNGATGLEHPVTTLTWQASAGATLYQVCYDTVNDNACANDNWINVTNPSYDANTSQGTTYYWHVRAVNATGTTYSNGAPTAFWSFTTSASACFTKADPLSFAPAPGATKGFWTTIFNKSGFSITISNITITWDNSVNTQEITHLQFGPISIDVDSNDKKKSPVTIPNINILIPAYGSVPLDVYYKYPYQDGVTTTEELVVNFATSNCSPLVIR